MERRSVVAPVVESARLLPAALIRHMLGCFSETALLAVK